MSDETPDPVVRFLDEAEEIYQAHTDGYLSAESALERLGDHVSDLRDAYEGPE